MSKIPTKTLRMLPTKLAKAKAIPTKIIPTKYY